MLKVTRVKNFDENTFTCVFISNNSELDQLTFLSDADKSEIEANFSLGNKTFVKQQSNGFAVMLCDTIKTKEDARKAGVSMFKCVNQLKITAASFVVIGLEHSLIECVEGAVLVSYQFLKYFKDETKKEKKFSFTEILVKEDAISAIELMERDACWQAVSIARSLVNEPQSYLNATQYSSDIQVLGKQFGFDVEVFEKSKIEALKMGGLLAVNKGSLIPPTFNILTYRNKAAKNEQPLALVGKGIVYDTGGLSLKPTANSMDLMKCDMGGSASVVGAMCAIAKAQLPVNVVAFIPVTDNRPGGDAYAPGDVVVMHNGLTVEVKNTDAEGRMVLADAMSYAEQYKPELLIELATLTGSAVAAIGSEAAVAMGTASDAVALLKTVGEQCHERIVEFPFWKEYDEQLKSDIADLKNLGGSTAGAITAGKFLSNFTTAPYVHIDIAGPAFIDAESAYRTKGGTGYGVRLLFDFIKEKYHG
jgi:leucyl aminopeptidase